MLDHACALRGEGKYREAYAEFILAAKNTDNILEKAGIRLNAVDCLTESSELGSARVQLSRVQQLLGVLVPSALNHFDKDEIIRVAAGAEIEEAEILSVEGELQKAVERFTRILEQRGEQLKRPRFLEFYDGVQMRRATIWVDMGSFARARASLEELEPRLHQNFVFLFYLGHCCVMTKELRKGKQLLE